MGNATTVIPDCLNFNHPPRMHLLQGCKLLADWELLASLDETGRAQGHTAKAGNPCCLERACDAPCCQYPGIIGRDFEPPMLLYSESPDRV